MERYKLIGSYLITELESKKETNKTIVYVPLLNNNGELIYDIHKSYMKLLDSNLFPNEDALDLLCLAMLVYLADTRISRELHSQDSWSREIEIELPVYNLEYFTQCSNTFQIMLNFLTGDFWNINFTKKEKAYINIQQLNLELDDDYDHVTLFSGGMDSLINVINHLERKDKIILVSHAGDSFTKNAQKNILQVLKEEYSESKLLYFDIWMVFEKNFIPRGGNDNTTRSRSFLFIAYGIFISTSMKNINVLEVPENGLIALNIPLDPLRIGSHSTRTTHPFYFENWIKIVNIFFKDFNIINSYYNKTKGEMAIECLNTEFLLKIINKSVSCSSISKARWKGVEAQHCGYCVPCIIRRSAMQKAFGVGKDKTEYTAKNISEILTEHSGSMGIQLRSFQLAVKKITKNPESAKFLIHKTGPLNGDDEYLSQLEGVYVRGLLEVNDFIEENLLFGDI